MSEFGYGIPRRSVLLAGLANLAAAGETLRVGPGRPVETLAAAARVARAGMRIEVDAGDYVGDVAVWSQHGLTLRAVGGRVRLIAAGRYANGKGIFVTQGEGMRIEGFDFIGAAVPDRNGAGIRQDRGSLHLRDCAFRDNEMGLLTGNEPGTRLEIEACEFGPTRHIAGYTHNLYVGRIAELRVTGSHFHHGRNGHLLKSRAALSEIRHSRFVDGPGGEASYELEFPNGGQVRLIGNTVEQGERTGNPLMLGFGFEGYGAWPVNGLDMRDNTLLDRLPGGGEFLRVAPGPGVRVQLRGNRFLGPRAQRWPAAWEQGGNTFGPLPPAP